MAEHDLTFDPISPNKQRKNKSLKSKSGGKTSVDSATTPEIADVVVSMVPVSRTQFRVVVELEGDKFIDEINPFKSANRTSLINKLADRWPTCCKESFLHLHDLLPDKANETLADIEAEASARQQEESTAIAGANDSAKILEETPKELIDAAKQFLNNPALFDELREDFGAIGIVGEEELATTTYVTGTSRIGVLP